MSLPTGTARRQSARVRPFAPDRVGDLGGVLLRLSRRNADARTALHHRLSEQASRTRRGQMRANRIAAGRLAADRDPCRIASKRSDVVVNPTQRRLLIHQAEVAGILGDIRMGKEPERAEPVVEADPDDARFLDDLGHVRLVRAAVDEPSPMDEHIDRQPGVGEDVRWPPHIDEEAIFRFRSRAVCAFRGGAIGAEGFRLPDILPGLNRLRRAPALVANRGGGIGNSEESFDGAVAARRGLDPIPSAPEGRPDPAPGTLPRKERSRRPWRPSAVSAQFASCVVSNTYGVARRL